MAKGIQVPVTQTGLSQSINQAVKQVGPINVPVNVNPAAFKNLAQPLGRISGLATEFEKSIAASNARVIAFGASVGVINGFQNALSQLVTTGIEVQKILTDISAISGKTGAELAKFGDELFNVASNTGQSFKTASEAALEFSRQGKGLEETLNKTNAALTLSRFTGLSAADAVNVLTAAQNSFQDSAITTDQILNKLIAVDSKYAVSAADLANAISRVGSVGVEAGVSLDELNAAVTAVQERTARGGAVIGNAFKTIFTNIRSDNAIKALRDIGVESLDLQGNLKPSIQVLQELAKRVQTLGEGEQIQILETVASKYNINILSALLNDLTSQQSKFTGALQAGANASDEAFKRQKQLNETLSAAINQTTNSVAQLFNKLAEIGVNENLKNILTFVNDLLGGLNKFLDSKESGGNFARGFIDGIGEVFFNVGLPILAAIFVKLTRDIAKFGIDSLKTILGVNQQVRERQALEQAVVNTLIKDQQVMATILALSSDRAKQEQYLLSVYNQQIAALQKVQTIAQSVAPALMGAGLSATTGQVRRRAAGGYLPSQEASDVRRGVGGASPSSKVVSIPNFAFGGGKRGTMIANTSEYIVPNFANGGSAIFNPDMVKTYGLPDGAKKITAAGGYIPNFAAEKMPGRVAAYRQPKPRQQISDPNSVTVDARWSNGAVMLLPSEAEKSKLSNISVAPSAKKEAILPDGRKITGVKFDAFAVIPRELKSRSGQEIAQIEERVKKIVYQAGSEVIADFDPLQRPQLSAEQFGAVYDKKGGAAGAASAVAGSIFEAAVDYALNPQKATNTGSTLDVPRLSPELIKAFGIGAPYGPSSGADYKISAERDRAFADQIIKNKVYQPVAPLANASTGYVPNFAKQSALSDAIGREIGAGVNPSQIRVTQDGRLRSAQNPNGLAVINTRDEPNGKIPNFAKGKKKNPTPSANPATPWMTAGTAANQANNPANAYTMASQPGAVGLPPPTQAAVAQNEANVLANKTGALIGAFSALTLATSSLQSGFKDTENAFAKAVISFGNVAQESSKFALYGSLLQDSRLSKLAERGGVLGGIGRIAGNAGIIGAVAGAGIGVVQEISAYKEAGIEARKQQGREKTLKEFQNIAEQQSDVYAERDIKLQKLLSIQQRLGEKAKEIAALEPTTPGIVPTGGVPGRYDVAGASSQANLRLLDERRKLEEELQKIQGENEAALDQVEEKQRQITNNEERQKKLAIEQNKEAERRINLEQAFEKIALSILKGDNERLKTRAQIAAQDIRNASSLSDYQRQELDFRRKIEDFEEDSTQKKRDLLNSTVQTLVKQGTLSTVTKEQADELKRVLESGVEIKDNAEIVTKLGLKNAQALNTEIKNISLASALEEERTRGLIERFTITQRAAIEEQSRLKLLESQNSLIVRQAENLKNLATITSENKRSQKELNKQFEIQQVKGQISSRGFATPEEELRLLLLEKELSLLQQRNAIEAEGETIEKNRLEAVRDAYRNFASRTLGETDIGKKLIAQLSTALTPQALDEIFGRMRAAANKAANTSFVQSISQIGAQYEKPSYLDNAGRGLLAPVTSSRPQLPSPLRSTPGSSQNVNGLEDVLSFARNETKRLQERGEAIKSTQTVYQNVVSLGKEEVTSANSVVDAANKRAELEKQILDLKRKGVDELAKEKSFLEKLGVLRVQSQAKAGVAVALNTLEQESQAFSENFAKNTTFAFRDGLTEALSAAISQTDDLGNALQNVARTFLQTIQQAFLQQASGQIVLSTGKALGLNLAKGGIVKKYAGGGKVVGGSGYKDDVPAMLTGGEFVMRKSAVQKYGMQNLEKMNDGGIFLPGVRGAGPISGYGDITRFAKQTTTSGATDVMMGGGSSAFINLEDQSARLSRFGLLNEDTINQEIRSAQEQGLNLIREREAYRTAQRKAFQKQLVSTLASAAISYGVGKLIPPDPNTMEGMRRAGAPNSLAVRSGLAYGGMLRRFAAGGPTDDIPALLMGGEYVMSRQSTRKYGKQFFDAMNQGRAPRFAEGGMVGGANGTELGDKFDKLSTKLETTAASNISININVTNGGTAETQTQGDTNRGGIDYKKMGDQIRQVVIQTINEEKRLGGSLRTR